MNSDQQFRHVPLIGNKRFVNLPKLFVKNVFCLAPKNYSALAVGGVYHNTMVKGHDGCMHINK